jgi:hypothetical protein
MTTGHKFFESFLCGYDTTSHSISDALPEGDALLDVNIFCRASLTSKSSITAPNLLSVSQNKSVGIMSE